MFKSITQRIISLHIVAIVITSGFMPLVLYFLLAAAAEDLQHRSLRDNADLITRYLAQKPGGALTLSLPANLEALFSEAYGRYAFSVLDASGAVLFSSLGNRGALIANDERASAPVYLEGRRGKMVLLEASVPVKVGDRPVWVQISQDMEHRDVLIDDIVREFFARVGWITIPILLFLLVIDVTIFRRALRPLLSASELAAKIGPDSTELRLPLESIPSEIRPLVRTINEALDRLEHGFRVQKDFTADAAHELRTPLSILQARVDAIADKETATALSRDIARMKRIVSQLLDIAELESFRVKPGECADLKEVCVEVAEFLAPMAISEQKQILLEAPDDAVKVKGNAEALFRALRNLVENAIRHTPAGTVVTIELDRNGTVSVADQGPGIPASERGQIFQRFWRKDRRGGVGSGLGLPIVKRIMDAHNATISVSGVEPRGCMFQLGLQAAPASEGERRVR
ncbi:MAG: ATP-binding protein [Rhodomicrobium sp.]